MRTLLTLAVLLSTITLAAQDVYLHCGKLIDTKSGSVLSEKTIIVSGSVITSVEDGYVSPQSGDVEVIDLKDKTVMPGLMDLHVHIESQSSPTTYLDRFTKNDAEVAFGTLKYAKRTLMAGFTTVRDMGGSGVNIALRKAIASGDVVGPRIITAGKGIGTTGGHADPTNGRRKELMGDPGPKEGVVNSVDDAKKAVRQRYKNGADCIKITATGGVLSLAKSGQNPQFTLEEIQAICETAKDYGMIIAAHAHGDEGMRRAVLGGVTTIEHGTFMSEATMDLMIEHGTYYVPTITAGATVAANAKIDGYFPAIIVPKALEIGPKIHDTFAKAYQKGVKIAFGTDAAVFPHGDNAREFGYMVNAGMKPIEAIQSATITAAEVLRMQDELGQIAPGFIADIVATNEDPSQNIETMMNVVFVMKKGKIYKID